MNLPEEIIHYVLSFLELQDIKNFSNTCKFHRMVICENYVFWKRYLQTNYPEHYQENPEITDVVYWQGETKKRKSLDDLQEFIFNIKGKKYIHDELLSLERLDLSNCKLTRIPESIGNLVSLKYLNIGRNELTSIPKSIGKLNNLQGFNIYNNNLTNVPESMGQLYNLIWITLDRVEIPESIRASLIDKNIVAW